MATALPRGPKQIIESVNPEIVFDAGGGVVIARHNDTPTSGASGTLAGLAGKGSLLLSSTGNVYVNTGTDASPTWTELVQDS